MQARTYTHEHATQSGRLTCLVVTGQTKNSGSAPQNFVREKENFVKQIPLFKTIHEISA